MNLDMREPVLCGPPYLNGPLHAGHCVNLVVKDFVNRYEKDVLGKEIDYWYVFDSQGHPIEHKVRKTQNLYRGDLVKGCLKEVQKNLESASRVLKLLKLKDPQKVLLTNSKDYKVKLMNFLRSLYEAGYLKKERKVLDYCYTCNTILSNAELEKKTHRGKTYVLKAKIISGFYQNRDLLFATTRPESLGSNEAICLKPFKTYYLGYLKGYHTITGSKDMLDVYIEDVPVERLIGSRYQLVQEKLGINRIGVVVSDQMVVDEEDQSDKSSILKKVSAVHLNMITPVDHRILKEQLGLTLSPEEFKAHWSDYARLKPKLEQLEYVLSISEDQKTYTCWKCNQECGLNYLEQYFLKMDVQERASMVKALDCLKLNNPKYLVPLRDFFSRDVDWCISRSRPYGTPLPLAFCRSCKKQNMVQYQKEDFDKDEDCYYPFLKKVLQKKNLRCDCKDSPILDPVEFSVDVWVDSGYLPLYFEKTYDVFIEGQDQVRGWFYSTAFLNHISKKRLPYNGLAFLGWLIHDKEKLSKSKGNYVPMVDFLTEENVYNFRSFALSRANSKNSIFSEQLVDQEKKYVNNIVNVKRLVESPTFACDLTQKDLRSFEEDPQECTEWVEETEYLLKVLKKSYDMLQYTTYWDSLRNFVLKKFSRMYLNGCKKNPTLNQKIYFKKYLEVLFRYVNPVLGVDDISLLTYYK